MNFLALDIATQTGWSVLNEKKELISYLKKIITKGDLILVDGSKEMEMEEIVEAIKK